jgi:hypothetical protein
MELDDLKIHWQKESMQNLEVNKQTMEQLQLILKEKTSATLSGMKKKHEKIITLLIMGVLFNIIVHPFLHFLLGDPGPVFRLTYSGLLVSMTFVVICLVVIFFYWIKYRSMSISTVNTELKVTLSQNIERLKRSLKQEVIFIIALFVTLFTIGRMTSQYLGNGAFGDIFHTDIMLAIGAGMLMFAFYVYKRVSFYNQSISELQQYLNEYKANVS